MSVKSAARRLRSPEKCVLCLFYIPLIPAKAGARKEPAGQDVAFFTYILASQRNGTLYVGMTDDLVRRMEEHKDKARPGFTAKYAVMDLVWFETHPSRELAFTRERRIKEWKRLWKIGLIERANPNWRDLTPELERLAEG